MDGLGILEKIFERYFRTKKSIIVIVLIGIIISVMVCSEIEVEWMRNTIILAIIGIIILYSYDTVKYNSLPINKKDDAILIRIIAKDKSEYEDIKFKFGNEFEKYLNVEKNKVTPLYIPYHLIEKHSYNDEKSIINLLLKTNSIFLTTIRARSEDMNENTKYITEFNLGIIHPTYIDDIEKMFQKELNILGKQIKRIEYNKEEKLKTLEVTAQKISLVCRYMIARAFYLSSEFDSSLHIAENLYKELNTLGDLEYEKIKRSVTILCYDIHITRMLLEDSTKNKDLEYMEKELNEANRYISGTHMYFETMSVICFLKTRDIKKTYEYLGTCKKINENQNWLYSEAFLKAYNNESESKIIHHYKSAFGVPYPHIHLISFIEEILDIEPDRNMLRLALTLLYLKIKEDETARDVLSEYLQNKPNKLLEKNTINQLNKLFGKKRISNLLENN